MFSKRLRELRKEKGYTQQDIASFLGVNRATVAGYETKGIQPGHDTLVKLADFFGCSVDYLLGNTDERSPADKIKEALSDDPELQNFWDELKKRDDLQMMFKQAKDLPPETIKQVIEIIKTFEREQEEKHS